ncbi:RidA family protein [Oceanicella actignis]|uniref:Enamine deaminase RidA, house cleaning of reactive enamine intermediates, YjgF/YER057c/UK114 family n=1 Tax=Oceanicella actignis TaxID=1189325 RepID=A0A1M7RRP4_9RHOB|nr:RidA family protein [Oceanicella actignis]TYO89537.1 enamine deaminase RidA (YjgF/YER057c/UK114 family) [Oceanicella actignis]SET07009.1 Enamine deaminase RidA, house cleaning of reactive enamine intermediates, YjgF/YER057c/UK114 family [Oceanicella actignis]SHN48860.1 Enamine deaminase RidA, house cleaning of reactive enamine intermediates, YjgF/YER057c/UK114 family [Oceanicella actignis]
MTGRIEARLAELGIELPAAPAPAANYVPWVRSGDLVFVSGQIAKEGDRLILGKLGANMEIDAGMRAARACALNLLAQLKTACGGDLDRVTRVVKLTGYVNAAPDFENHPIVMNGASDLMAEVFGPEIGAHARAAVGVPSLPLGVAVEVEGVFEIR